jgi:hypothetical protein
LAKDELEFTQKILTSGYNLEFIMFNTCNTNSNSNKHKLQAILKNGIREPKEIHPIIIDKNELSSCSLFGYERKCTCCGAKIVSPIFCSDRKLCPICNARYSNKRGLRIHETFDLFDTEYMIHDVLTTPKGYFSAELDKFDIINKLHSLASLYMCEIYGEKASGVRVVHTNSTKNPLAAAHFHIHILISDKKYYQISQTSLSGNEYIVGFGKKEVRVYQEDLQKLRDTWRKILNYPGEVNLKHHYSKLARKKRHLCKYICRDSIYDINEFLLKKGEKYQLSLEEEQNYAYQVQNKKYFKRIRWFGEYSDSKRANLYYTMHKKNIQNAYKKYNFIEICPECFEILPEGSGEFVKITKDSKISILIDEEEYEFFIKRLRKLKK